MKYGCLFFSLFIATLFAAAQPTIRGTWEGRLAIGANSLRVVLHITGQDGAYVATLDSPDQGAKGIPVSSVRLAGDSLYLEVTVAKAKLSGRLTSDSTFSGEWFQGAGIPLELKKTAGNVTAAIKRPQTPVPPFSYNTQDVRFFSADKTIQFGATITKPAGNGPFPAVLLLTGSGPQNRDEELFGHKPFAVIADDLTRKGFLVLRVDDRGVGQSTGNRTTATSKDFADDAKAALAYLRSLPEVDKEKVGLLGHSEGGMLAQMIGAEDPALSFIVLLAAPGIPVVELMALQSEAVLLAAGVEKEAVKSYLALYRPLVAALAFAPAEQAETITAQLVNDWIKKTPKEKVIASTNITDDQSRQRFISDFSRQASHPWFRYFLRYNPDSQVRKIKAKVLALNGDKDVQVTSGPNLAGLRTSLQKSASKQYELVELKGLNHLFQHCKTCSVNEYGELEETIAPEALQVVGNWLLKEIKKDRN